MKAKNKNAFSSEQVKLARYAKTLAHPARIKILETLAQHKNCICGEIVEVLPLSQSTVSQHLKELKMAGVISGEVDGLTTCYCLDSSALGDLEQLFLELFQILKKSFPNNKCC